MPRYPEEIPPIYPREEKDDGYLDETAQGEGGDVVYLEVMTLQGSAAAR